VRLAKSLREQVIGGQAGLQSMAGTFVAKVAIAIVPVQGQAELFPRPNALGGKEKEMDPSVEEHRLGDGIGAATPPDKLGVAVMLASVDDEIKGIAQGRGQ
jgi:hypothetical protein